MFRTHPVHHTPHLKPSTLPIYAALLLLAFHYYLIVYINANFLTTFINEAYVGYMYIIGSICNIIALFSVHKILRKIGNVRLVSALVAIEIMALLMLAFGGSFQIVALAFIIQHTVNPVILFCLDIFLESASKNSETGHKRGVFLTILNTPAVVGAFVSGIILTSASFSYVYAIAAVLLVPLFFIFKFSFKRFQDPHYRRLNPLHALGRFGHNNNVKDIWIDNILLQFFYALMTIYFPVYLYQVIGFSFAEIGLIYAFALIPFILLQIPIGRLADDRFGEKEFLIASFILLSFATMTISFMTTTSLIHWALLIFVTRIGAAIIEISAETYFFKQVNKDDADMIGLFRMSHATAFSLMPLLGVAALIFISMQYLFVVFGIFILILGLRYAFDLTDTR